MNYLELQQRANIIVQKVNEYEEGLTGEVANETDLINEHKYADLESVRPLFQYLFAENPNINQNDDALNVNLISSNAPINPVIFNPYQQTLANRAERETTVTEVGSPVVQDEKMLQSPEDSGIEYNFPQTYWIGDVHLLAHIDYSFNSTSTNTDFGWWNICYIILNNGTRLNVGLQRVNDNTWEFYIGNYKKIRLNNITTFANTHIGVNINCWNSWWEIGISLNGVASGYWNRNVTGEMISKIGLFNCYSGDLTNINTLNIAETTFNFSCRPTKLLTFNNNNMTPRYNNDLYNDYHLLTTELHTLNNTPATSEELDKLGIFQYNSASITDAIVTECQVANIFKWNTTAHQVNAGVTLEFHKPVSYHYSQVPGVVLYHLGNEVYPPGYLQPTINESDRDDADGLLNIVDFNSTALKTNYGYGSVAFNKIGDYPIWGARYCDGVPPTPPTIPNVDIQDDTRRSNYAQAKITGESLGCASLKMFMPGLTYFHNNFGYSNGGFMRGLTSPLTIWSPEAGQYPSKYNANAHAIYHELVFKNRRQGCKEAGVDFTDDTKDLPDNDPQGLAMRVALAQQKDYYNNRPWFNELNELYGKEKCEKLADEILKNAQVSPEAKEETIYPINTKYASILGSPEYDLSTGILTNNSTSYTLSNSIKVTSPFGNLTEVGLANNADSLAYIINSIDWTQGRVFCVGNILLDINGVTHQISINYEKDTDNMNFYAPSLSFSSTHNCRWNMKSIDRILINPTIFLKDANTLEIIVYLARFVGPGEYEWASDSLIYDLPFTGDVPTISYVPGCYVAISSPTTPNMKIDLIESFYIRKVGGVQTNYYLTSKVSDNDNGMNFHKEDFTINGTPTLTDFGTLLNTSNTSYLSTTKPISIDLSKDVEVVSPIIKLNSADNNPYSNTLDIRLTNNLSGTEFFNWVLGITQINVVNGKYYISYSNSYNQGGSIIGSGAGTKGVGTTAPSSIQFKMIIAESDATRLITVYYRINNNTEWTELTHTDAKLATTSDFTVIIGRRDTPTCVDSYDLKTLKVLNDNIVKFEAATERTVTEMTDDEFYKNYRLDYETWATALNKPL